MFWLQHYVMENVYVVTACVHPRVDLFFSLINSIQSKIIHGIKIIHGNGLIDYTYRKGLRIFPPKVQTWKTKRRWRVRFFWLIGFEFLFEALAVCFVHHLSLFLPLFVISNKGLGTHQTHWVFLEFCCRSHEFLWFLFEIIMAAPMLSPAHEHFIAQDGDFRNRLPPLDRRILNKMLKTGVFFRTALKSGLSEVGYSQNDINYIETMNVNSTAPSYLIIGAHRTTGSFSIASRRKLRNNFVVKPNRVSSNLISSLIYSSSIMWASRLKTIVLFYYY